jgi:hypothetical protein
MLIFARRCAWQRRRSSKEIINWIGLGLLVGTFFFTAGAAVFAGLTWLTMDRTAKRELRAYISLKPSTMTFDGTRPLDIVVMGENHGQTPASDVVNFIAVHFPPFPLPPAYNSGNPGDGISTQSIWPNSTYPFIRGLGRPISPERLAELQAGTRRLFVFSIVRYRDVFGRRHYTRLCASVDWRQFQGGTVDEATGHRSFTFAWDYDSQHNDFD